MLNVRTPSQTLSNGHYPSGHWVLVELTPSHDRPARCGVAWLARYRRDTPQLAVARGARAVPLTPAQGRILSAHPERHVAAARAEILNRETDPARRAELIVARPATSKGAA